MSFTSYSNLFTNHGKLLWFGFLLSFSSSFGQTYFIGVFGPAIQTEFELSHTLWGTIYLIGTLASAAILPWTGSLIDRFKLSTYTLFVGLGLIVACLVMSLASGFIALIVAIFLLRQFGQALADHISATTMARYFEAERGRALAVATMGSATGQAFLPFLAVLAISLAGWRWTYASGAILLSLFLIPMALYLLRQDTRKRIQHFNGNNRNRKASLAIRSWTRPEVLRDTRFYLLIPGYLAPSIITTALFLHHLTLAEEKGWSHTWITGNYIVYSASAVFTALVAGPLIDRYRAVRILPLSLVPLILALSFVVIFDSQRIVPPYMLMLGMSAGLVHTAAAAMWPELYGVRHLGAIKSLGVTLMVFGSALGPAALGGMMDVGVSIEMVCVVFIVYSIFSGILMYTAFRRSNKN